VTLLDGGYDPGRDRAIVLDRQGWHPGVIGIVASRLVERYHRPAILISRPDGDGVARGSARSIPGFDLLEAIRACAGHLERFGGHAAAAGFDIRTDAIEPFRAAFADHARALLPGEPVPELRIDLELRLADVTPEFVRYLQYVGPFGSGNPAPVFAFRQVRVTSAATVGADGQHLRLRLADSGRQLQAIGFRMGSSHGAVARPGSLVDVAAQLQEDEWRGRSRIQAKLVDLRPAGA
jgi:single-stranded-DNA-specific exonuclease